MIPTTNAFAIGTVFWAILAVIYHTLFRGIHPKLPAGLRTESLHPTGKGLRFPAVLYIVSETPGLIVIL